jgi:hypothetical protein
MKNYFFTAPYMIRREKIHNFQLNRLEGLDRLFANYPEIYSVYLFGSYAGEIPHLSAPQLNP